MESSFQISGLKCGLTDVRVKTFMENRVTVPETVFPTKVGVYGAHLCFCIVVRVRLD